MERIKCLFISTHFPPGPGGVSYHAFHVVNELKKSYDWEMLIAADQLYSSKSEINEFNNNYHSNIITLKETPTIISLIKKIIFLLKTCIKFKPDFIVCSGKHATWFGAILKLFTRTKLVSFGHGTEFGTTNKKEIKINKLAYSYVDLLISVSNFTLNYIQKNTKIKPKKSIVVHNGADHNHYNKIPIIKILDFKLKNQLVDKKILITLGSVTERKGQKMVISALPKVLSEIPNVYYYCIGIPLEKEDCLAHAKKLGVRENVIFLGKLENDILPIWLNSCEIFLMTSTHTKNGDFEGFGISVIEAALCGKPAIVTKGENGLIEAIEDKVTGIGVKEQNITQIADSIVALLNDQKKLDLMGENAYKRAINNFTWEEVVKKIERNIIQLRD